MSKEQGEDWIVVAEYAGNLAELQADNTVAALKGSGFPALRLPTLPANMLGDGAMAIIIPVRVLVPPEREEDARQLLKELGIADER